MAASEKYRAYFSDPVINAGWLPVPHLFRRSLRRLGLDEATGWFVLELLALIWDPKAKTTLTDIAEEMGRDVATVRRHSQKLSQLGLVVIHDAWEGGHRTGSDYDLSPLWEKLATFAEDDPQDGGRPRRVTRPRSPQPGAGGNATPTGADATRAGVAQPFNRAPVRGMNDTDARHTTQGRAVFNTLKEDQEQQEQEQAAAAAAIYAQICGEPVARELATQYPQAWSYAGAIVAEASKSNWRKGPCAALRYLLKTGWQPPATATAPQPAARCPGCGGDPKVCNGLHGFAALAGDTP